jgi:DNA-binding MarR family transcriptional regulator
MNVPELEESLGFNIDRVAQLYRRELVRALADYDLTPEQWQVLAAVASDEAGFTQSELAALTVKDKHSMSRMLDRLERAGWVARRVHPEDARASRVVLSHRKSELRAVRAILRNHFARVNGLLDEVQQRQLITLLKTLRRGLEELSARQDSEDEA